MSDGSACGSCPSCYKASKGVLTDILEVAPDGARIKIDQIRQLKKDVAFGPLESRHKVVIINPADAMTTEAANSFLKLLEEPIEGVVLLLVTSMLSGILPTIRSRAQQVPFGLLSPQELALVIQRTAGLAPDKAMTLAENSGGMVDEALLLNDPLVSECVNTLDTGSFRSLLSCVETAKKMLENKDTLKGILSLYVKKAFAQKQHDIVALTMSTLAALRFNVNQSLLLETYLLKLGDIRER
jgi:DNA polymerase III gamma/tau subunit